MNCTISDKKCIKFTVGLYVETAKSRKKIEKILRNEEKNKLTGAALARAIETACDGLIYISETDSPFRPIFADKRDAGNLEDAILMLAGEKTSEISKRSADAFFSRLILDREWHGESEKGRVRRFRILKDLLYANLTDLTQYRLGKTRITIYVIGLDVAGNIAGIQTEAVET